MMRSLQPNHPVAGRQVHLHIVPKPFYPEREPSSARSGQGTEQSLELSMIASKPSCMLRAEDGSRSGAVCGYAHTDSRVTIHMAASLDGFIARKDGRVDWLETADEFA